MRGRQAVLGVFLALVVLATGLSNPTGMTPQAGSELRATSTSSSSRGGSSGSPTPTTAAGEVVTHGAAVPSAALTPDYSCVYPTIHSNATATVTANVTLNDWSDVTISATAGDELLVVGLATYLDGSDYPGISDTEGLDWTMIDNVAPETVFGNNPQSPGTSYLGVNVWTAVASLTEADTIGFHSQYFQTVWAYDIHGTVSATTVGPVAFVSNPNGTTLTRTVTGGGCDLLMATHQTETADFYNGTSSAPSGWVRDQLSVEAKSYYSESFHTTVLAGGADPVSITIPTNNSDFYVAAGVEVALDATPPSAPQNPVARAVASNGAGLVWTNAGGYFNDNVTVYRYAAGPGCTGAPTAYSLGGVPSTVSVGGLVNAATYGFQIAEWNPLGSSPLSACASATISPPYYDVLTPAAGYQYEENTSSMWGATGQFGAVAPNSTLTSEVQPTDIRVLRFDPQIDWTNLSLGVSYRAWNGTIGRYSSEVNLAADWAFCESLKPKCDFILQLPAETNSTGDLLSALHYALNLGVRANAYTIGNEPENWEHFGIPWTSWTQSDASPVSPNQYAAEVKVMAAAIRSVVPGASVDIESYGCFPHALLNATVAQDGGILTAIGCHWYPSGYVDAVEHQTSLQDLYNGLWSGGITNTSSGAGTTRLFQLEAMISADWPGRDLPVWIDEFGIQYGWSVSTGDPANWVVYERLYPDFAYTAGAIAQTMAVNLTQLLYFDLWGQDGGDFNMIGNGVGTGPNAYLAYPVYDLYRYFLPNVTTGAYYPEIFHPLAFPSYAGFIRGWSQASLLVVNTNATAGEWVSYSLPVGVNETAGGAAIYWDGTTPSPAVTDYVTVPTTFYVGPQSVLLVDTNVQPPSPSGGNQTGGCNDGTLYWTNAPPPYGQSLVNVTLWLYDSSGVQVGKYSTNGPADSLTISGLQCGEQYSFRVQDWYSSGIAGPISGIIGYFAGQSPGSVLGVFGKIPVSVLAILVAGVAIVTTFGVAISLRHGNRTRARRLGR
jgi:hypothetical protein